MRRNIIFYYALILLLVMGAFASMALNSYGVVLMSYATLGFALVFLYEWILLLRGSTSTKGVTKIMMGVELTALGLLCVPYFFQGLSIEVPFSASGRFFLYLILLAVNGYHFYATWNSHKETPTKLKLSIAFYFAALLLLIVALYLPAGLATYVSFCAFGSLLGFVATGWWRGTVIVQGEETNGLRTAMRFRNKSGIQLVVLAAVVGYSLLTAVHLLPPLYFGSMPNGYLKVVRQWDAHRTDSNERIPDPREFEQAYKKFLENR